MIIKVKKVDGLVLPKRGSKHSAGFDIIATSDPQIVGKQAYSDKSGWYKRIDYIQFETNLYIQPDQSLDDEFAQLFHTFLFPRSSISKYNLILTNSIGVIDADYYKHQVLVRFAYNPQPEDYYFRKYTDTDMAISDFEMYAQVNLDKVYKKGDRVAQFIPLSVPNVEWVVLDDLNQTERTGGFGSTGQ